MAATTREGHIPPKSSKLHTLVTGTGITFVGLLIGRVFEYLTRITLARSLGPALFGAMILALGLFQIGTSLAVLGLSSGIARFVSFERANGQEKVERTIVIVVSGLRVAFPLSLVVGCGLWLSRYWLASVFEESALVTLLGVLSWIIPFYAIFQVFIGLLRGVKDTGRITLSQDIFGKGSRLALLVVFFALGMELQGAILAYVIGFVAMAGSAYWLSLYYVRLRPVQLVKEAMYPGLLSYSLPLVVSTIIMQLGGQANDTLVLGYFQSSDQVGMYGAALSTAQILMLSLVAVRVIFMPIFTELYATQKWESMNAIYRSASRWALYLTLPVFSLLFMFPGSILTFFGQGYEDVALPLRILSVGNLISCIVGPTGQILLAIGRTRTHMILDIFYVSINLVLNLLLVPWLAATGAALATTLAMIVWNLSSLTLVVRGLRIYPFSIYQLRFVALMVMTAVLSHGIMLKLDLQNYVSLAFVGLVQIGAVFLFVYCLGPASDRDVLQNIGKRLVWVVNGGNLRS